jgi:Leucine-rich repeat (LRR) protein
MTTKQGKLGRLPTEVFKIIRTFLLIADHDYLATPSKDGMLKMLEGEAKQNWRNFLSVSNDNDWKILRKETMILSLNGLMAGRFQKEKRFKGRVLERINDADSQLVLPVNRFRNFYSNSNDRDLNAFNRVRGKMPSSVCVRVMGLSKCRQLEKLGDYENLQQLRIEGCPKLNEIGLMPNLTSLSLKNSTFTDFPLDNLVELVLAGNTVFPMDLLNGMNSLRKLTLSLSFEVRRILKLPQLEMLKVQFVSANCFLDISELTGLQYFEIHADMEHITILGKERIYPILTTLITPFDDFVDKRINSFKKLKTFRCEKFPVYYKDLHKYLRIPEIQLMSTNGSLINRRNEVISISDKVRSLSLGVPVREIHRMNQGRHFLHSVCLMKAEIHDLSVFSDVQIVVLKDCPHIYDISPLKTVPYITLDHIQVTDFSPLGDRQKYLKIANCFYLRDIGNRFRRIKTLEFESCLNLTKIEGLSGNKFLSISNCSYLKRLVLRGNHTKVSLINCESLVSLLVLGKIYSLTVRQCKKLHFPFTTRFEYLNGLSWSFFVGFTVCKAFFALAFAAVGGFIIYLLAIGSIEKDFVFLCFPLILISCACCAYSCCLGDDDYVSANPNHERERMVLVV